MSDYFLNKIYDSLLSNKPVPKKPIVEKKEVKKPFQSLTDIYQQVLTERVGIYAKPIGQETVAPAQQGMKTLGVADNEEHVQNALNSVTVKPATDSLLKSAGNWNSVDDYDDSLKLPLAMAFANKGFTSNEINKLISHKAELTSFVEKIVSQQLFNAREVVVHELQKLYPEHKDTELNYLFDYIFAKKPKIADVGVGMGEVVLTVFTDCIKGKVGDLDSKVGSIEVKSTGGRLAKPDQINYEFAKDLAKFLKENKVIQKTNKTLFNLKNNLIEDVNGVLKNQKYINLFTNDFKNRVFELAKNVDAENFHEKYQNSIFGQNYKRNGYDAYERAGYIVIPIFQTMQQDYEKEKNIWLQEAKQAVLDFTKDIRNAFEKNIFKKQKINKVEHRKIDYAITTRNDIKDIATASSVLDALKEFYFTDFNLTSEQKAHALTLLVSEEYRDTANKFKGDIVKFFNENDNLFKRGSDLALQAAVFAMQVSVYAHEHFKYLLLIDKATKNAISLNANSFYTLATRYIKDSREIGFKIKIDADKARGGSQVDF